MGDEPKLYDVWISEPCSHDGIDSAVWARVEDAIEDLGLVMDSWDPVHDGPEKLILTLEHRRWTRERIEDACGDDDPPFDFEAWLGDALPKENA